MVTPRLSGSAGGALASLAARGLVGQGDAATRHPQRGGHCVFPHVPDATGLDPHRNTLYPVSMSLAAMSQGLLDLDLRSEPAPGIASEWKAADLLTYTFKLRKVLFHNGREVDAAAEVEFRAHQKSADQCLHP
jgi:ABC-type transport system substrate-binding protein